MRVTLVNRLAGIQRGGGEVYDLSLAAAIERAGIRVDLITGRPLSRPPLPLPGKVPSRLVRTPYLRGAAHRLGRPGWRLLDLDLRLFERGAERLIASDRPPPDIVQVTGMPRLARRLEARHGLNVVLLFPGPPSTRNRDLILACRTVVGVGAVTPYLQERFDRTIHDMTAGVDADLFKPGATPVRNRLGIPEDAPLILYAGRLVPLKNLPLLVQVFAKIHGALPGARLLVVGDGPLRSDLLARADRAGLRCGRGREADVVMAGEVPHDEMPAHYAAADLLLLTSINESFSLVALEAMACGIPVVAPRVGYLPNLIDDGATGHLYAPGDGEACAAQAISLLKDAARRAAAGSAARERALQRHSWEAVASEFRALYRDILTR